MLLVCKLHVFAMESFLNPALSEVLVARGDLITSAAPSRFARVYSLDRTEVPVAG